MIGRHISLRASDGHNLRAYEAKPDTQPRGGIVLVQEIFGVTAHIRGVCDGYASRGYHVVAPALFDRISPGLELGYSKDDAATGRALRARISWEQVFADVGAAQMQLGASGKTAVLGYCWGGTVAWRSATQLDNVAGAVCYYATQVEPHVTEQPRCPVLMHFGERDPIATLDHAQKIRAAHSVASVQIHTYPASHGFNCDEIENFHPPSAELALQRSLAFLASVIG
ncbi:MAG: dienelactone hydrolase family protein [Pseudomonadota bacterium]